MVCFHDMRWQIDPSCYCFAVRKHGGNSENKGLVGVFVFNSFPNKPNVAAITLYRFIKLMLASWMQVTTHFTVAQRKTFTKVKSVKSWREAPQIAQLALFFFVLQTALSLPLDIRSSTWPLLLGRSRCLCVSVCSVPE